MANKEDFEIWAGTDNTLTLHARDSSNAVYDLTGKTVTCLVGFPPNRPYLQWSAISKTGTVTDATNGVFTVDLSAADTQDLYGNYVFQASASDGTSSVMVSTGRLKIRKDILS